MSAGEKLKKYVTENRDGILNDLIFAALWVGIVSVLFEVAFPDAPTWAFYLCLAAGIPAYYGFFLSLEIAAKQQQQE